ncbi:hypothetical protein [Acididesulfobacillus acetoxydans]|nr:hypothetical protein [Acididesulfobacillus acetoxydans]
MERLYEEAPYTLLATVNFPKATAAKSFSGGVVFAWKYPEFDN